MIISIKPIDNVMGKITLIFQIMSQNKNGHGDMGNFWISALTITIGLFCNISMLHFMVHIHYTSHAKHT